MVAETEMKTEERIEKIANCAKKMFDGMTPPLVVADVATDHGFLAEKLAEDPRVSKVFATDISKESLMKLIKLKEQKNLSKIEPVLGDGLHPLGKVDLAIIAGIGGFETMKMLSEQNDAEGGKKCRFFVLQPAQNVELLRKWIISRHFCIVHECVARGGEQFYQILCVDVQKRGLRRQSVKNVWLGTINDLSDPDFVAFLGERLQMLKFLDKLPMKKIRKDKMLSEKFKLKKIIEKMLKTIK